MSDEVDAEIPYRLSDHDRLIRLEAEVNLNGKLGTAAISLSGIAVALIIAFGSHLI